MFHRFQTTAHMNTGAPSTALAASLEDFVATMSREPHPGARPRCYDLLFEPYFRGLLTGSGVSTNNLSVGSDWSWYKQVEPVLKPYIFSGIYQCTRRGIRALYGFDVLRITPVQLQELNTAIERNYRQPSSWYNRRDAEGTLPWPDSSRPSGVLSVAGIRCQCSGGIETDAHGDANRPVSRLLNRS